MFAKHSELAFRIVNSVLKIKEGDVVAISGDILNGSKSEEPLAQLPLIEELAINVRKKGAFPLIDFSTEKLMERFCHEVTPKMIEASLDFYKNWVNGIDYFIDIGWRNNPYLLLNISESFFKLLQKYTNILYSEIKNQKKKILLMGFPTKLLSDFYSVDHETLQKAYYSSINCDYHYLEKTADKLISLITKCSRYDIISENHKLGIELNSNFYEVYKGDISNSTETVLPAGKLVIPIKQISLDGIFTIEKAYFKNFVFEKFKIHFSKGKVKEITIDNNQKGSYLLQNFIINSFTSGNLNNKLNLCIGFNHNLNYYTNYSLFDSCIQKNISLQITNNNNKEAILSNLNSELALEKGKKSILNEVINE